MVQSTAAQSSCSEHASHCLGNLTEEFSTGAPELARAPLLSVGRGGVQEDEAVRRNRLALLRDIAALPKGILDLSLLPGF
jgi:hypothetical protein